jgi:hypothetical protein
MVSRQFRVQNFDYGRRIQWHENDRQDDQTKTLYDQARTLGEHFASLPERIFFQMLQNQTDFDLLPAIPLAPDGAALYATTAGGADRFGVTNGNIVTGTGVASAAAIRADFFSAISRMKQFRDTENQPLWSDFHFDRGFSVIAGAQNWQVLAEAFRQSLTSSIAPGAGAAGVTNIILESGLRIDLWLTQRITDNKIYVFMRQTPKKAMFEQVRSPLREAYATMDTSDQVRDSKLEYIQWDCRHGYSIALPYQTVLINN